MLSGRNPCHKDTGNFQKLLVLCFFLVDKHGIQFSYLGYCITSLCDEGSRLNNFIRLISLITVIWYLFIPTVNLRIIPGPLFCLNCFSPLALSIVSSWIWRFPSFKTSPIVALFSHWCDNDPRFRSKSSKIFCWLSLFPFKSVTTWYVGGSKFSQLPETTTCSGSDPWECREIWSYSKWTEFEMVSANEGRARKLKLLQNKYRYIRLHFNHGIFHLCYSCHHLVEGVSDVGAILVFQTYV